MKSVAKLIIVDDKNKYLMMYRGEHPTFGDDPDLPGGTMEAGETLQEAMVREVYEEIGVAVSADDVKELYVGTEYSRHNTEYGLYIVRMNERPQITISWEHSGYRWLDQESFLREASGANDTFMRMAADKLAV